VQTPSINDSVEIDYTRRIERGKQREMADSPRAALRPRRAMILPRLAQHLLEPYASLAYLTICTDNTADV
jgi:hypothetical protein